MITGTTATLERAALRQATLGQAMLGQVRRDINDHEGAYKKWNVWTILVATASMSPSRCTH
eukprot:522094-Rhodomonas_salina.1